MGRSTKEIARDMGVSSSTARTYERNVLEKLGVRSRAQAAALARKQAKDEPDDPGKA